MDTPNHHDDAPRTMRALVQPSRRGPQDLVLTTDRPRPVPGAGEYLVRVSAAGVNFADVMQARGTYGGGPTPPYVAGFEAAGEIVGVGALATSVPAVYRSLLDELERLVEQGVYPPGTPQVHALGDGPRVLEDLGNGRTRGKHALDPWQ